MPIGVETNGYAINVGFSGKDGHKLIALIEGDCSSGGGWNAINSVVVGGSHILLRVRRSNYAHNRAVFLQVG